MFTDFYKLTRLHNNGQLLQYFQTTRKRPLMGNHESHAANLAEAKLMEVLHEYGAQLTEEHEEAVSRDAAVPRLLNPGNK